MTDPAAYPKPIPFSQADALAFVANPTPDVPGAFLAFVMLAVEPRIGEWRFAGAARSLAAAFGCITEFYHSFVTEPGEEPVNIAEGIGAEVLEVWPQLADGWSGGPDFGGLPHRVIFFGEGGAPYDDIGFCVVELEPEDAEPFFDRAPETHRPPEWGMLSDEDES